MKNKKRIFALIGAILLLIMYASTLFFAIFDPTKSMGLLKASLACTIILPVFLYAYSLVYRLLQKNTENDISEDDSDDSSAN